MHIGVIAPPWMPILRHAGVSVESAVYDLVESFVDAGHDVTLFAPAGSQTRARLAPVIDSPPGSHPSEQENRRLLHEYGCRVQEAAAPLGLDVLSDHTEIEYENPWRLPVVRTVYGPAAEASLERCHQHTAAGDVLIGVSQRQADLYAMASANQFGSRTAVRFCAVIPSPVDASNIPFYGPEQKEKVAAFIGRCRPDQGPVEAIEVAMRAGVPLRLALSISDDEREYFEAEVEPLLRWASEQIERVGDVRGGERDELLGRASVLISATTWEEPFAIVIPEALARGTPVVALRRGVASEIIQDGVTDILTRNFASMASRLPEAMTLDPQACRDDALARFDRGQIAAQYVDLARRLTELRMQTPVTAPAGEEALAPIRAGTLPAPVFSMSSPVA